MWNKLDAKQSVPVLSDPTGRSRSPISSSGIAKVLFGGFLHAWSGQIADSRPQTAEIGVAGVSRISSSGLVCPEPSILTVARYLLLIGETGKTSRARSEQEELLSRSTSSKYFLPPTLSHHWHLRGPIQADPSSRLCYLPLDWPHNPARIR